MRMPSLRTLTAVSLYLLGAFGVQITTTTRQTVHGVGVSGAWWVNDLALYPDQVRQNVSDLLLNQTTGGWIIAVGSYWY